MGVHEGGDGGDDADGGVGGDEWEARGQGEDGQPVPDPKAPPRGGAGRGKGPPRAPRGPRPPRKKKVPVMAPSGQGGAAVSGEGEGEDGLAQPSSGLELVAVEEAEQAIPEKKRLADFIWTAPRSIKSEDGAGAGGSRKKARGGDGEDGVPAPPPPPAPPQVTGPQFTLVDGKLVLDRRSLVLRQEPELHEMEEAEEEGHGFTTSLSFLKRTPAVRWSNPETMQFYTALRTYGLNFTLMAETFPGRTREQLKQKYHREARQHADLVNAALLSTRTFDYEEHQAKRNPTAVLAITDGVTEGGDDGGGVGGEGGGGGEGEGAGGGSGGPMQAVV